PVQYTCPDGNHGVAPAASGRIDWNCDGQADDTAVNNDINGDRACVRPGCLRHLDTPTQEFGVVVGVRGRSGEISDDVARVCATGVLVDTHIVAPFGDDVEVRTVNTPQPLVLKGSNDWKHIAFDLRSTLANVGGGCGGLDQNDGPGPKLSAPMGGGVAPLAVPTTGTGCRGEGLADGAWDATRPNVVRLKVSELTTASTVLAGREALFPTQVVRTRAVALAELEMVHSLDGPASFVAGGCTVPPDGQCNGSGVSQTAVVDTLPKDVTQPASVKAAVSCSAHDGAT